MTILDTPRLLRGGSWFFISRDCPSAHRYRALPADTSSVIGFRVVRLPREEAP
jgi:formylglycine-generating enzyme required for sulfatase activity